MVRAADDLHRLVEIGERALARIEALEQRTDRILAMGERIEAQADQVLDLGERVSGQAEEISALGKGIEDLGERMLVQGEVIERQADAVATGAADLVEALPTLEQAVSMVSPLEGAVERIGRAVDRLPGGARPGPRGPSPTDS